MARILRPGVATIGLAATLTACAGGAANNFKGTWRATEFDGLGSTYTKECRFTDDKVTCNDNRIGNHDLTRYDASYKSTSATDADPDRPGIHFQILPDHKMKIDITGPDGANYRGVYTRVGDVDAAPMPAETYGHANKPSRGI